MYGPNVKNIQNNIKLTINYTKNYRKWQKKKKKKLQIQEKTCKEKKTFKKITRLEVAAMPLMFHLLHTQRSKE